MPDEAVPGGVDLQALADRIAIEDVMVAYHRASDATVSKGDRVAELVTDDVVWEAVGRHAPPGWTAEGREALRARFDRNHERMPFALHHLTGGLVTVDGDRAAGWWSYFQSCTHRGVTPLWIAGEYHVDLHRVGGRWLIAHLRVENHFTTPFDKGWVEVPHVATP